MINKNELRLGSAVRHSTLGQATISELDKKSCRVYINKLHNGKIKAVQYRVDYDSINPIPITEEWLLRLGFTYSDINGDSGHWQNFSVFSFQILGGEEGFVYANRYITTVHQLQNLYQSLCGKELTLS